MLAIKWWVCGVLPITGSWFIAAIVLRHAETLGLVQEPNHRSSHERPTPHGGGLGIAVCGIGAGVWLSWGNQSIPWEVVALSSVVAAIGARDDIGHLSPWTRLVAQFLVCGALLWILNPLPVIRLTAMQSLGGLPLFGVLLLAGVWWVNLFNFMDGIDGIAGSQAAYMLTVAAALSAWFHPAALEAGAWLWMVAVAVASIGFLALNWPPAKIFMGDVGSTYLGFMIYALALMTIQAGWLSYSAWLILGATFVTDATLTLIVRILRRERWYEAHRRHVYQRLSRRWGTHLSVTLLNMSINVLWLLPLSLASLVRPQWASIWVMLAYAPLVAGAAAVTMADERCHA